MVLANCRWQRSFILLTALLTFTSLVPANVHAEKSIWLENTPKPAPTAGPSDSEILNSVTRGIDYLVAKQNKDGSWGSATRTKNLNIYAPIPGSHHAFRMGTTSLVLSAIIQSQDRRPKVVEAMERCENWLYENVATVKRANQDAIYNVWAHAFAIEALIDLMETGDLSDERDIELREMIAGQVDLLDRYESVDGGWGYYDFRFYSKQPTSSPTSFTTATGLIALQRATDVGVEVPEKLVRRSIQSIQRQRKPDFSYFYSFRGPTKAQPMRSINRPGGSLGRSQCCNYALRLAGDDAITDQVMNVWLDRLFARNGWLEIGRKRPIPHESHFLVAGYFYYYGHWYAARSFSMLAPEDAARHKAQMGDLLLSQQEPDGTWWDYPLYDYHQPYGTAMAIMALMHSLEDPKSAEEYASRLLATNG